MPRECPSLDGEKSWRLDVTKAVPLEETLGERNLPKTATEAVGLVIQAEASESP